MFSPEKIITKRTNKDVFGAYMLEGAEFDIDNYDMPYVDVPKDIKLPESLISYSKIGTNDIKKGTYIHFYLDDYIFDGFYGMWNSLIYDHQSKKGFNLEKLNGASGIICPDYSIYGDFPEPLKIWNTYRSRTVGSFLNRNGICAIPNFHCNGPESYSYCFGGLRKHTIVAVSTLGCLRSNADKQMFLPGLEELIVRIEPRLIILYGSESKEIIELFKKHDQKYLFFASEISIIYGGTKYGNEGK